MLQSLSLGIGFSIFALSDITGRLNFIFPADFNLSHLGFFILFFSLLIHCCFSRYISVPESMIAVPLG